ncbi:MAG: carboxypeptidase regulatory-like domain-containing protein [Bacteroidales bacterium]|nr:carboxypeptidase regulatory-like domain-containing protein [Bacteroidales bacterium]
MMKKCLITVSLLIITALSVNIFISCDKETDCTIVVTVIDGQTQLPVPGANIFFGHDSSDFNVEAVTDAEGKYTHVYKSPAIYEMRAWIDYQVEIDAQYYWAIHKEGYNSFRLREGEIIERDLVLTESDSIKKIYQ